MGKHHFAKAISVITHPVIIFPFLMISDFEYDQLDTFLVVFLLTFFFPGLVFAYLYKKKKISNFDVSVRTQRYPIYVASLLGMVLSLIYLKFNASDLIFQDFSRLIIMAITIILLNFKTKVSVHAALITLLCLNLVQDFNVHPLVFLMIPLVMYSRLTLKRHSLLELVLGVGIVLVISVL